MQSDSFEETTNHNQLVSNIGDEKKTLISQVWCYILNELADDLSQYQKNKNRLIKTIDGMEQSLQGKKTQLHNFKSQVNVLEKQTTSIQPTISTINDLLQRFGFNSFFISEANEGRHYQIIRANGENASYSLSEGEKTFITFLYFYHLIKGAQFTAEITSNRVVVFDDPISSLDSDILYIVSCLIKVIMEDTRSPNSQIKQVFILTHNVYFHKEISFNKGRPSNTTLNEKSFWLVKNYKIDNMNLFNKT